MHTFGFEYKPWTSDNAIADAHEILSYLHEAIDEDGLAKQIYLQHMVIRANFNSDDALWTVTLERDGQQWDITCDWFFGATGYYNYAEGNAPHFEGREDFEGLIVHPQFWPEDLAYHGKEIVVIGSGATAVTLIPAMADDAKHITMLQRSPSYVMPQPRGYPIANGLRKVLPAKAAYAAARRFNIGKQRFIYGLCQRNPKLARRIIRAVNAKMLPTGYDVDTHFKPTYDPWDQRLCAVPDADLFRTIGTGKATVVTDKIARFTKTGILLESGRELNADIIVTATGLKLQLFGGIEVSVDGEVTNAHDCLVYKSFMLSGIPNLGFMFGYTNSSWTLKVDLVCEHLCRLLAYMDQHGYTTVVQLPTTRISASARCWPSRQATSCGPSTNSRSRGPAARGPSRWITGPTSHGFARVRSTTPRCGSAALTGRWLRRRADEPLLMTTAGDNKHRAALENNWPIVFSVQWSRWSTQAESGWSQP